MRTFVAKRIEKGKLTVDANHTLDGQTVEIAHHHMRRHPG